MSRKDYRDILDLLYSSRQYTSVRSMQEKLLKPFLSKFGAESGTFYVTDATSPALSSDSIFTVNIAPRFVDEYCKHYYKIAPFFNAACKATAYRDNDLMPHSNWERLEIFRDFRQPQDIYHEMDVYISEGNTLGVISIHRPRRSKAFSNRELGKARVFARHFGILLRQCHKFVIFFC